MLSEDMNHMQSNGVAHRLAKFRLEFERRLIHLEDDWLYINVIFRSDQKNKDRFNR